MLEISGLPEEVLLYIMSFLNLRDRKSVRLVCKDWLRLNHDVTIIKDDVTVVDYHNLDGYISPNIDNVFNVKMCVLGCYNEPKGQQHDFFRKYGHSIKSVQFIFHRFWQPALSEIFKFCLDLQHLAVSQRDCTLDGCDCGGSRRLPCDSKCGFLADVSENKLQTLKMFSIECNHIIKYLTDNAVMVNSLTILDCYDRFGDIASFLERRGPYLNELVLCEYVLPKGNIRMQIN